MRLDEVSSGKHSIGQSRRAKALRKEISVIKRKLAHQREGGSGMGDRESVGGGDRGSSLPHHPSSAGHHDEGGESSSQEIGGKGVSRKMYNVNIVQHLNKKEIKMMNICLYFNQ